MYSYQKSSVSGCFVLEALEPRIMLSADTGAVVSDVPQIVVNYNDSEAFTSCDESERTLVGFYKPAADFKSGFDVDEETEETVLQDDGQGDFKNTGVIERSEDQGLEASEGFVKIERALGPVNEFKNRPSPTASLIPNYDDDFQLEKGSESQETLTAYSKSTAADEKAVEQVETLAPKNAFQMVKTQLDNLQEFTSQNQIYLSPENPLVEEEGY